LEDGQVVQERLEHNSWRRHVYKDYIFKFIGTSGVSWKEVCGGMKFTKDGTPLNVANPHLIVVKQGDQ